jgi:FtsP/CotA-like multicopper oxidase with cupredoxin domain
MKRWQSREITFFEFKMHENRARTGLLPFFVLTIGVVGWSVASAQPVKPGCEVPDSVSKFILEHGFKEEFRNAPVVQPTAPHKQMQLEVKYTDKVSLAGCDVRLRSYGGKLVGDTIRARPGDTLYIRLSNKLPAHISHPHPQDPPPTNHHEHFSFNITNLHTHGLHTSPEGTSDNVFLEVKPGGFQDYEVHIHNKHPVGTFWYHAHVHGSTAV